MKTSLKVLLLFAVISFTKAKADTIAYIRIDHIAKIDSKYIRPVLISTQKLNKLDFFSQSDYEGFKKLFPKPEDFVDSQYKFIVTDCTTLRLLNKYINRELKNYDYSSLMEDGYTLTTTGRKRLFIPYRLWHQFSNELIIYLQKKRGDENVIYAIPTG